MKYIMVIKINKIISNNKNHHFRRDFKLLYDIKQMNDNIFINDYIYSMSQPLKNMISIKRKIKSLKIKSSSVNMHSITKSKVCKLSGLYRIIQDYCPMLILF